MTVKQKELFYQIIFFAGLIAIIWEIVIYRQTIIDVKIILGIILIIVTYGHLLAEPLFSPVHHIFPRTLFLIIVLILPANEDSLSLDYLINYKKSIND